MSFIDNFNNVKSLPFKNLSFEKKLKDVLKLQNQKDRNNACLL